MQRDWITPFSLSFCLIGIVSRDWKALQWIPSDGYEEFTVGPEHIFKSSALFSCINYFKKTWFCSFLYHSHSANDEWQPRIDLLDPSCTCTIDFSKGMQLFIWLSPAWCQLLADHCYYFKLCEWNGTLRLLDLSASEHWSRVMICGCNSSFAELLSWEKLPRHNLELKNEKDV